MGLADLFKRGLEKTRSFFAGSFTKLAASSGHFDEDMLDELEELLIRADCGVQAADDIMDHVKQNIRKTGDDSNMLIYLAGMLTAMIGLILMIIRRRADRT